MLCPGEQIAVMLKHFISGKGRLFINEFSLRHSFHAGWHAYTSSIEGKGGYEFHWSPLPNRVKLPFICGTIAIIWCGVLTGAPTN
jgi:hypothetical protein